LWAVLRFVFYQLVIKIYSTVLKILKQLGWTGKQQKLLAFVFNQKLVHVLVISITCLVIFINLTVKTNAEDMAATADKTIIAQLIQSEYGDLATDEELIMETFDSEAVISDVQQSYLDNLSALKPQTQTSMNMGEEENVDELQTIQGGTSMVKPDIASTRITKRPRKGNVAYAVRAGDTISTIAEEFEISVNTILWENNLSAYSLIRPGDQLIILPTTGVTHKVAKGENLANIAMKYNVTTDVILEANKLADVASIRVAQELFIPGGRKLSYPSYAPTTYSGLSVIRNFVQSPNARPLAGNKMNWPTVGYRITQYFSWRHYAVDIANKMGTPIYAADAGVVEVCGWGTGYGNQIVIDHGGGKKTRYGHLSKVYVKKGDKVSKGQNIGAMGSTGWSTGPHLHFEVIINGVKYNPLNYIK
jgi:murein DD-endopeptidase MepM/ murein hydrolase activator NlpD